MLHEVGKRFDNGVVALEQVRLSVGRGEFVALLGPSGCGKSSLLRMVAGLEPPSTGRLEVPQSLGTGFVFQEPTLMPWATVFDNVWLPLRIAGAARRDAEPRVRRQLERVGLEGFAAAYPAELSGGMKMRVSIARALVTGPQLLLLDEPFAALDEITRQKLNDDLLAVWSEQALTVLFVTHSVFEAVYLSQRVIVMSGRPGRVAAELTIDRDAPRNAAFRASAAYAALCGSVSAALESSHGGGR